MGCTASKLENEETVRRCKERCRLMRDAVYARYHLATAHSDYCRSLRLTGDALCTFAAGEPLAVAGNTPAVFINTNNVPPQPPPPSSAAAGQPRAVLLKTKSNPTPPRHHPPPTAAVPRRRRNPPPKLPHILSESSLCSTPRSQSSSYSFFPTAQQAPSIASETSSVWDWENFYPPPSPPGSDYFRHRSDPKTPKPETAHSESDSAYNLFHSKYHRENRKIENANIDSRQHREGSEHDFFPEREPVRTQGEPEEVLCSEWGDRDSFCTNSSSDEEEEEREISGSARAEPVSGGIAPAAEKEKVAVRHRDLKEIVEAVKENFEKAAVAGDQLSDLLEIGRDQLDRSFKQLKKTVHHSSSLLSKLNSRWTSKPPLVVKYRFDTGSLDKPGGPMSLCSTLDRLLAWEKKLYLEVKAREGVKIEHEKKLSALQSQESKGGDEAKLDKTKTSITRLQSLIVVTSQAVSTTSAAIDGLRDSDLVPQLVELCHRIMYMWRSMHQHHETQSSIVKQVRGLVNRSSKNHSTSETHKQATRDLESAVSSWHSSFNCLIKFQRDFILSLHSWFKLNLIPINNNYMEHQPSDQAFRFFDEWKLALDHVPDTVCSEAIKSFINVVHVIHVKQCEELKIRKRTETASKALEKKSSSLRDIERKFYSSYSAVGVVGIPDSVPDDGQVLDARDPLAEKKMELAGCKRQVEDEMVRHSKAVEVTRAMTLNNLQMGLPVVFQALTSFSSLFIEALESVCKHSYAVK